MGVKRDVRVEIDELVLHGVRPEDRHAVALAFEREVARAFEAGPLLARDAPALTAAPIPSSATPEALGRDAAQAVRQAVVR